jgi:aryl-alcohol dehydrogenase-like predicted oxidoreductase
MLHNPDSISYTSEKVWDAFTKIRDEGLTERLGIAPGPANGFTLDMIECFERYGDRMDWAMIILNPFEPWPGQHVLAAAEKNKVDIMARVVDYGGLFHDDVKPGHKFRDGDHRTHRPGEWIEHGVEKLEKVRPIAQKHGLSMLQLSCLWTLGNTAVKSVVPTLIQEHGEGARTIESKLVELAALPEQCLSKEEIETIRQIGDNTGCMALKGASQRHPADMEARADEWAMRDDLMALASSFGMRWTW